MESNAQWTLLNIIAMGQKSIIVCLSILPGVPKEV